MSRIGRWRDRLVDAALGVELGALMLGYQQSLQRMESREQQRDDDLAFVRRRFQAALERDRIVRDDLDSLVGFLSILRKSAPYREAMSQSEPLVSVRIASYARTEELMEVAIPSVLGQTYDRLELIVVNDGPNARTRRAIAGLSDSRVRYEEFPARHKYPVDAHARWMVAGSPGMNRGADLAAGAWIAPLDEDDAFTPDHIEKLLALAHSTGVELAYGALVQRNLANGEEHRIWSYPPAVSQFSFQGALYLQLLNGAFRYDESSWLVEEPGDWNLIRRMSAAGVSMAATEDIVAVMNQVPYTHKPADRTE